jgi:predicted ATPase
MIQQVSIRNFKCLRDVTIDLEPFTVFVGANGSGKTSVLQAIDLLCRTFRTQPGRLEGEYRQHRSFGTDQEVEISCNSNTSSFWHQTISDAKQQLVQTGQLLPGVGSRFAVDDGAEGRRWKPWQLEHGTLPNPVWLQLDPNALRNHGANPDPRLMNPNGQGLHSATASMNLEDPDLWQKLQEDLRRIVPSVRRLRHTPQNQLLFDTINGKGLSATQISEGTLLTLGLLTAIHGVNKPGILLLDDLDRALHPKAQRELIELLRGVQTTNPEIQIIATTHSPYMLDCMKPEEVRMTYLNEDGSTGSTACDALNHHPDFEKWKETFDAGEMWSIFGESWTSQKEVAAR